MHAGAGRDRFLRQSRLVLAALADLVLPAICAGCGSPGPPLCPACSQALSGAPRPAWPDPTPDGLPVPWALAPYAGPVRAALLAHKEKGRAALAGPLGDALGRCLVAAARGQGAPSGGSPVAVPLPVTVEPLLATAVPQPAAVLAVPVPSSRAARRSRGEDPLLRLSRRAAAQARAAGLQVSVLPALRHRRATADQAGLTALQRDANVRGAFEVTSTALARVTGRRVVLLDDVVTTGATLAAAAQALRAGGAEVIAAAVVAATVRTRSSRHREPAVPMPAGSGAGGRHRPAYPVSPDSAVREWHRPLYLVSPDAAVGEWHRPAYPALPVRPRLV